MKKEKNHSKVEFGILLEFEEAFPEETKLTPQEYLKGGDKDIILNIAAFFLSFKSNDSQFEDNAVFLSTFFSQGNKEFANGIYTRIIELERSTGKNIGIIRNYSSLKLFECFFTTNPGPITQTKEEFEKNLFKAYLVFNSDVTKKVQLIPSNTTKDLDDELRSPMHIFCMLYPSYDKEIYHLNEIWISQIYKAISLFQFLETNSNTKILLEAFLARFRCDTWRDYLIKLIPLTMSAIGRTREAHTDYIVEKGNKYKEGCNFIDNLIVTNSDDLDEHDFLTLRMKPFYKVAEGIYRIIFNLFAVEKMFKGAYFVLREVNETLQMGHGKVDNLKSRIGEEFSEKVLFYNTLASIYPTSCTRFSGEELKKLGMEAEPDYYIRKGKKIMLFESKDFLIPKEIKESFDFFQYEAEFEKKLYYTINTKGHTKNKAVMQLIANIKIILSGDFSADPDIRESKAIIYPVLVTHDHQYDTLGFNFLINYWFQAELDEMVNEGYDTRNIKPLVVVNIDSLIFNQFGLSTHTNLHELLEKYSGRFIINPSKRFYNMADLIDNRLSQFGPFSQFISNYFISKGVKEIPKLVNDILPELFPEYNVQ